MPPAQAPAQYALTTPTTLQSSSLDNFKRAASFWLRAAYIYFAYKATQVRHVVCLRHAGMHYLRASTTLAVWLADKRCWSVAIFPSEEAVHKCKQ